MPKLIIDTNILARFLVGDIPDQLNKAKSILLRIESGKALGEVSILVIDELIWVMEGFYEIKREVYLPQVRKILGLRGITIKELKKEVLLNIMAEFSKSKLDFTDLYLLHTIKPGQKIVSFDRKILSMGKK